MKKTRILNIFCVFFLFFMITGQIGAEQLVNPDKPEKGTHEFPLKQVWRISEAGETLFGNIVTVGVSDSGHVFARDHKNKEYYAFDGDGHFLNVFGKQGEGPGQVRNIGGASIYVIKNKVLITDPRKVHYFDDRGGYLTSRRKDRSVSLFLSETEFISAPASITGLPSDQAKMRYVNLDTGKESVITDFRVFISGILDTEQGRANLVMPSITPMMMIGYHDNLVYYGMNNNYTLYITDTQGAGIGSFSLQREGEKVSLKDREKVLLRLVKGYAPDELAIQMAKTLPDRQTCYSSIDSHDGMLYVTKSHFVPVNFQEIDIFSTDGRYQYQGIIKIEEGSQINTEPVFKNGHVYLVIEDEEGEIFIAKYRTTMPD